MVQTVAFNPPAERNKLQFIMSGPGYSKYYTRHLRETIPGNMDYYKLIKALSPIYKKANPELKKHIAECIINRYYWRMLCIDSNTYVKFESRHTKETLNRKVRDALNREPETETNALLLLESIEDVDEWFANDGNNNDNDA